MGKMRYIARCVVETTSPVSIVSGDDDPLYDTRLVRDVNGLPTLPATSIAGALKARLAEDKAGQWLGAAADDNPLRSLIEISDGLVHDSRGKPHDGRIAHAAVMADTILKHLAAPAPVRRDRVRLNHRGVVDAEGKFERSAVPTGARFTFEMRSEDKEALAALVAMVKAGLVLGGASRSGHGFLRLIGLGEAALDLSTPAGWKDYCAIAAKGIGADSPIPCPPYTAPQAQGPGWTLSGTIEGPLLIGTAGGTADKPKRVPYSEDQIVWSGTGNAVGGNLKTVTVIPGSGIKGPLRHRTEFHLRKRLGADDVLAQTNAIFGLAADDVRGCAGALRFHDIVLLSVTPIKDVSHVSLDRFSGGARDGALFADDMLWQPELTLRIDRLRELSEEATLAFEAALADMASGLCGIGAEWGEGAGVFGAAKVTAPLDQTGEAA